MGLSVTSYAIIGLSVPPEKAWHQVKRRVGDHDFPESTLFHPTTGKALWESEWEIIPASGFTPHKFKSGGEDHSEPNFGEFKVYVIGDRRDNTLQVFVAAVSAVSHAFGRDETARGVCDPDLVRERVGALQAASEQAGLWDPERFGLWSITDAS